MVDTEWLLDWSSGALKPGFRPLIDGYLSLNPEAREAAALFDRLGGSLLAEADPAPLSPGATGNVHALLDQAPGTESPERQSSHVNQTITGQPAGNRQTAGDAFAALPEAMHACLTGRERTLRWFSPSPWFSIRRLLPRGQAAAGPGGFLIRVAAGHSIPSHSHGGTEMTLVLQGGYSDCTGQAKRGDLIIHDPSINHQPIADPGESCIVATAFEGPLRLTGRFGRIIQPFFGF